MAQGAPNDTTTSGSVPAGALSALIEELAGTPDVELGTVWQQHLQPHAVIGRFELIREVGRGGFGVVWEARDLELRRSVAFKAVRGRVGRSREDLLQTRLLAEAEIAARLSHPNIVTLYDVGRTELGPYLVLELLRGTTLADRLESGAMPLEDALRTAVEIARGVGHAHVRGVIHRDLKPSNVFLCDDGQVKVLDFGLSLVFGHTADRGGTRGYMAPELWSGAPGDERIDTFALGVVFFQMLTGSLPFGTEGPPSGSSAALTLDVAAPGLRELIVRMLDRDPERRPRDAVEVHGALVAIQRALEREARAPRAASAEERVVALCVRGREYLQQTRRTSLLFALDVFSRAIELDASYALAHAGVAEAAGLLHMYYPADPDRLELADRESARALALAPQLAEAHAARGLTLFRMGRAAEAEGCFERAIELDPALFEAYYYYARASFTSGKLRDAARLFAQANRVREDYQAAFFAAQALQALGDASAAREAYAAASEVTARHMDLNPDDPRAATSRAVALQRIGRRDEALRWAEQALLLDPRDAGVRYNVACLYAVAGEPERALRELEIALGAGFTNTAWIEKDPDLESVREDPRFRELMGR